MSQFNDPKLQELNLQVEETKKIAGNNIRELEKRGENLTNLEMQSEELNKTSQEFQMSSKKVKEKKKRKYFSWKNSIQIGILLLVLVADVFCIYKFFKENDVLPKIALGVLVFILSFIMIDCIINLVKNFNEKYEKIDEKKQTSSFIPESFKYLNPFGKFS